MCVCRGGGEIIEIANELLYDPIWPGYQSQCNKIRHTIISLISQKLFSNITRAFYFYIVTILMFYLNKLCDWYDIESHSMPIVIL